MENKEDNIKIETIKDNIKIENKEDNINIENKEDNIKIETLKDNVKIENDIYEKENIKKEIKNENNNDIKYEIDKMNNGKNDSVINNEIETTKIKNLKIKEQNENNTNINLYNSKTNICKVDNINTELNKIYKQIYLYPIQNKQIFNEPHIKMNLNFDFEEKVNMNNDIIVEDLNFFLNSYIKKNYKYEYNDVKANIYNNNFDIVNKKNYNEKYINNRYINNDVSIIGNYIWLHNPTLFDVFEKYYILFKMQKEVLNYKNYLENKIKDENFSSEFECKSDLLLNNDINNMKNGDDFLELIKDNINEEKKDIKNLNENNYGNYMHDVENDNIKDNNENKNIIKNEIKEQFQIKTEILENENNKQIENTFFTDDKKQIIKEDNNELKISDLIVTENNKDEIINIKNEESINDLSISKKNYKIDRRFKFDSKMKIKKYQSSLIKLNNLNKINKFKDFRVNRVMKKSNRGRKKGKKRGRKPLPKNENTILKKYRKFLEENESENEDMDCKNYEYENYEDFEDKEFSENDYLHDEENEEKIKRRKKNTEFDELKFIFNNDDVHIGKDIIMDLLCENENLIDSYMKNSTFVEKNFISFLISYNNNQKKLSKICNNLLKNIIKENKKPIRISDNLTKCEEIVYRYLMCERWNQLRHSLFYNINSISYKLHNLKDMNNETVYKNIIIESIFDLHQFWHKYKKQKNFTFEFSPFLKSKLHKQNKNLFNKKYLFLISNKTSFINDDEKFCGFSNNDLNITPIVSYCCICLNDDYNSVQLNEENENEANNKKNNTNNNTINTININNNNDNNNNNNNGTIINNNKTNINNNYTEINNIKNESNCLVSVNENIDKNVKSIEDIKNNLDKKISNSSNIIKNEDENEENKIQRKIKNELSLLEKDVKNIRNTMLKCSRCYIYVHKFCYITTKRSEENVHNNQTTILLNNNEWLCQRCEYEKKFLGNNYLYLFDNRIKCYICLEKGGAFIQINNNLFAHTFCAIFCVPDLLININRNLENFNEYLKINNLSIINEIICSIQKKKKKKKNLKKQKISEINTDIEKDINSEIKNDLNLDIIDEKKLEITNKNDNEEDTNILNMKKDEKENEIENKKENEIENKIILNEKLNDIQIDIKKNEEEKEKEKEENNDINNNDLHNIKINENKDKDVQKKKYKIYDYFSFATNNKKKKENENENENLNNKENKEDKENIKNEQIEIKENKNENIIKEEKIENICNDNEKKINEINKYEEISNLSSSSFISSSTYLSDISITSYELYEKKKNNNKRFKNKRKKKRKKNIDIIQNEYILNGYLNDHVKCDICLKAKGIFIKCQHIKCEKYIHPLCGFMCGLYIKCKNSNKKFLKFQNKIDYCFPRIFFYIKCIKHSIKKLGAFNIYDQIIDRRTKYINRDLYPNIYENNKKERKQKNSVKYKIRSGINKKSDIYEMLAYNFNYLDLYQYNFFLFPSIDYIKTDICAVCFTSIKKEQLIFCKCCNICVHKKCYLIDSNIIEYQFYRKKKKTITYLLHNKEQKVKTLLNKIKSKKENLIKTYELEKNIKIDELKDKNTIYQMKCNKLNNIENELINDTNKINNEINNLFENINDKENKNINSNMDLINNDNLKSEKLSDNKIDNTNISVKDEFNNCLKEMIRCEINNYFDNTNNIEIKEYINNLKKIHKINESNKSKNIYLKEQIEEEKSLTDIENSCIKKMFVCDMCIYNCSPENVNCILCTRRGGAFKSVKLNDNVKIDKNKNKKYNHMKNDKEILFVHMQCILYTPHILIQDISDEYYEVYNYDNKTFVECNDYVEKKNYNSDSELKNLNEEYEKDEQHNLLKELIYKTSIHSNENINDLFNTNENKIDDIFNINENKMNDLNKTDEQKFYIKNENNENKLNTSFDSIENKYYFDDNSTMKNILSNENIENKNKSNELLIDNKQNISDNVDENIENYENKEKLINEKNINTQNLTEKKYNEISNKNNTDTNSKVENITNELKRSYLDENNEMKAYKNEVINDFITSQQFNKSLLMKNVSAKKVNTNMYNINKKKNNCKIIIKEKLKKNLNKNTCCVCNLSYGYSHKCVENSCTNYFHISCAHINKFFFEYDFNFFKLYPNSTNIDMSKIPNNAIIFCREHSLYRRNITPSIQLFTKLRSFFELARIILNQMKKREDIKNSWLYEESCLNLINNLNLNNLNKNDDFFKNFNINDTNENIQINNMYGDNYQELKKRIKNVIDKWDTINNIDISNNNNNNNKKKGSLTKEKIKLKRGRPEKYKRYYLKDTKQEENVEDNNIKEKIEIITNQIETINNEIEKIYLPLKIDYNEKKDEDKNEKIKDKKNEKKEIDIDDEIGNKENEKKDNKNEKIIYEYNDENECDNKDNKNENIENEKIENENKNENKDANEYKNKDEDEYKSVKDSENIEKTDKKISNFKMKSENKIYNFTDNIDKNIDDKYTDNLSKKKKIINKNNGNIYTQEKEDIFNNEQYLFLTDVQDDEDNEEFSIDDEDYNISLNDNDYVDINIEEENYFVENDFNMYSEICTDNEHDKEEIYINGDNADIEK